MGQGGHGAYLKQSRHLEHSLGLRVAFQLGPTSGLGKSIKDRILNRMAESPVESIASNMRGSCEFSCCGKY